MASSWRRALIGITLGTFSVVWFVTFLAGNMDEGSSGSSMLSASAFTISTESSAVLTPPTASSISTAIESDLLITELPVIVATPMKGGKSNKDEDDVSSLAMDASPLSRATEEESSVLQPLSTKMRGDEEEGEGPEDTPTTTANISSNDKEADSPTSDSSSSSNSGGGEGDDDDKDTITADADEDDNVTIQTTTTSTTAAQAAITTSSPLACPYYDDTPSPFPTSFWYVKNPKTASSTLGGVFRSVAAHHGVEMLNSDQIHMDVSQLKSTIAEVLAAFSSSKARDPPLGLANHMQFDVAGRDLLKETGPLMLLTSVREPVSQFHSQYVENCKKEKRRKGASLCFEPAVEERTAMATAMEPDAQYAYVRGDASDAESAAAQYDFIFVRERLEESLVAFMILHGLDFDDIAHVAAKVRTDKYPGPEEVPAELNELVRSKTTEDAKLWAKANMLLDEKIAAIHGHCGGEAYFTSMLAVSRSLQEVVTEECTDYRGWYEKHGFSTVLRYWGDNGLAPRCRDFVVRREMRAWQEQHVAKVARAAMAKPREAKAASSSESKGPALDGWGRPKEA